MVKTRRCSIETSQTSGFSNGAIAWSSEILLYCTLFAITSLEFTSVRFPTQKLTNSMQGHLIHTSNSKLTEYQFNNKTYDHFLFKFNPSY